MIGRLSSPSLGHRRCTLGFSLAMWLAITLVAILSCVAEVSEIEHWLRIVENSV